VTLVEDYLWKVEKMNSPKILPIYKE